MEFGIFTSSCFSKGSCLEGSNGREHWIDKFNTRVHSTTVLCYFKLESGSSFKVLLVTDGETIDYYNPCTC